MKIWVWLKINQEGQTAGFGPCFHLPGFDFGIGFLSHSHIEPATSSMEALLISYRCTNRPERTCLTEARVEDNPP